MLITCEVNLYHDKGLCVVYKRALNNVKMVLFRNNLGLKLVQVVFCAVNYYACKNQSSYFNRMEYYYVVYAEKECLLFVL